jgi:hypothetical protein
MSSASAFGCMFEPGMTSDAPAITAAWQSPQAFAWNIGTTGITRSRSDTAAASATIAPIECSTVERCEYTTPFGWPVVPLV